MSRNEAKRRFPPIRGDAWFNRNVASQAARALPEADETLVELLRLPKPDVGTSLLEIGFGDGCRLQWLKENTSYICRGVEPSGKAVLQAKAAGLDVVQGTADSLPFSDRSMDVVVFGFCLYLCDRDDLFRIAAEADRVLKRPGWLVIRDFYSEQPTQRE